jgi:Patatin-like phospholipase
VTISAVPLPIFNPWAFWANASDEATTGIIRAYGHLLNAFTPPQEVHLPSAKIESGHNYHEHDQPFAICLQGGGQLGAAAGRILADTIAIAANNGYRIDAIAGTSAGAINAAVAGHGLVDGPEKAIHSIQEVWKMTASALLSPALGMAHTAHHCRLSMHVIDELLRNVVGQNPDYHNVRAPLIGVNAMSNTHGELFFSNRGNGLLTNKHVVASASLTGIFKPIKHPMYGALRDGAEDGGANGPLLHQLAAMRDQNLRPQPVFFIQLYREQDTKNLLRADPARFDRFKGFFGRMKKDLKTAATDYPEYPVHIVCVAIPKEIMMGDIFTPNPRMITELWDHAGGMAEQVIRPVLQSRYPQQTLPPERKAALH